MCTEGAVSAAENIIPPPASLRRNSRLGIAAGAVSGIGRALLHPELIIAGLIYTLTGSPMLVALVTIINKAGFLAPQLWASSQFEHRPRKMPFFILFTVLRMGGFALLILALWLLGQKVNAFSLTTFFVAYLVICVCGGAGYVTFMDMIGRIIPPAGLGTFLGARQMLGNMLAIAAGVVVIQPILSAIDVPASYTLLMSMGAMFLLGGMVLFSRCHETDGARADRKTTVGESLRRGFGWLKQDRNYRLFFYLRMAFRMNYLALTFFIPYGTEQLRARGVGSLAILGGIMVACMQVSRVLAGGFWGRLVDKAGFRACLVTAGACFILAPSLALVAPELPAGFTWRVAALGGEINLPLAVYLTALIAMGFALQGSVIGGNYFLVRCAPQRRRSSYVGFLNTVTSPLTLLPLAGALLARSVGMSVVFVLTIVSGASYLINSIRMRNVAA